MRAFCQAISRFVKSILADQWYYFIFTLLSLASCVDLYCKFSLINLMMIIAASAAIGFLLVSISDIFREWRVVRISFLIVVVSAINVMCITDAFLLMRFDKTFDADVFFVVCNTNGNEASGFLKTFLDVPTFLRVSVIVLACNGVSLLVSRIVAKLAVKRTMVIVVALCVSLLFLCVLVFLRLFGVADVQLKNTNILIEYLNPVMLRDNGYFETQKIIENCRNVTGLVESNPTDSTIFVVIVGESHNKSHTDLYGYRYNTMPRMKARMDKGELVTFDNCVAKHDVTHKVMKTILSLSNDLDDIEQYALFPVIFKAAGYRTECYDNQSILDSNMHICCDPDIAALNFDYRTLQTTVYDGDMIGCLAIPVARSMVFINLNGQHTDYSDRIPENFEKPFSIDDYIDVEDYKRETFCDYDNATVYVDSLLDEIIGHYKDYKTCVFYMSDHGEDLWDHGRLGHGFDVIEYIPFFVWGSDKFRETPQWGEIIKASDKIITSSDISHALLDLAGIKFHQIDVSRSFVNKGYVERDYKVMK